MKNTKIINGVEFETFKKEIVSANIIEVEVGTTGLLYNNAGKGSCTYFSIEDKACTNLKANVETEDKVRYEFDEAHKVEIILERDTELETFVDALRFALEVLESKMKKQ